MRTVRSVHSPATGAMPCRRRHRRRAGSLRNWTHLWIEFWRDLGHQKTRVPGLSYGVICVILRLVVLVEPPNCDRQTDTRRRFGLRPKFIFLTVISYIVVVW